MFTLKLHLTFSQHEGKKMMTDFSFFGGTTPFFLSYKTSMTTTWGDKRHNNRDVQAKKSQSVQLYFAIKGPILQEK